VTIACDVVALYVVFVALDVFPSVWVAFMGFVLAMAGLAVVSVPGGGGSFEVILSVYLMSRGLDKAQASAGAILYRIGAFWLPAFVSLFLFAQFRRRTKEIRAVTAEAGAVRPARADGRRQSPAASAARAARAPHMPWTPPPGGVDAEQR